MCGIAGFISKRYSEEDLSKMTNAIKHRGPDAFGHYFESDKGVGLGHRRLSIIDLSASANQPMTSHCGWYIMVYNGEVYNFKEIANKFNVVCLKTSSDSEVILEAFVKWGTDFVNQLNGMFAIAIFDNKEEKLMLFRDRMGIKPIYFFHDSEDFIFSSELKAINYIKKNKDINYDAVYAYLHLGYIPSNQTIYKNTFKLNPGAFLTYKKNKISKSFIGNQKIS